MEKHGHGRRRKDKRAKELSEGLLQIRQFDFLQDEHVTGVEHNKFHHGAICN